MVPTGAKDSQSEYLLQLLNGAVLGIDGDLLHADIAHEPLDETSLGLEFVVELHQAALSDVAALQFTVILFDDTALQIEVLQKRLCFRRLAPEALLQTDLVLLEVGDLLPSSVVFLPQLLLLLLQVLLVLHEVLLVFFEFGDLLLSALERLLRTVEHFTLVVEALGQRCQLRPHGGHFGLNERMRSRSSRAVLTGCNSRSCTMQNPYISSPKESTGTIPGYQSLSPFSHFSVSLTSQ